MPLNLAIDGPVGAGKSSIADEVARRLGILHLDTGAMYRAVGCTALRRGVDLNDEQAVTDLCRALRITVGYGNGGQRTYVDGEDVTGLDADSFRTLVRSKQNTKFTVETGSGDSYEVNCAATYVNPVSYRLEKTEAGYVKIDNFEAGSGQAAIDAFEDLLNQNASAFVIDLRGNPGGLTSELQTFLDYLLPSGDLFVAVDKGGKEEVYTSDSICLDMPMCVLVNSQTFSEAEIFAAVLQECDWATIMGEPTTGKTRTQQIIEISDGSAIRLSTHSFLTPNRVDISLNGVVPDSIVYNSDPSTVGTTEGTTGGSSGTASSSNDEQLIAALKLLSQTSF